MTNNNVNFKHLMLASEQTTAANTMLRCFHCSDKQKISFVSRSTKDLKNTQPGKLGFLHMFFLENEEQISEKNTGQCFLSKEKPTCKN